MPFVAEPGSKNKLSKRKIGAVPEEPGLQAGSTSTARPSPTPIGLTTRADTFNPVIVDFYEQVGYLPDAILNYLVLLGWALTTRRSSSRGRR